MGEQRAQFRAMQEGTAEDWGIISSHFRPFAKELPDRIIKHLQLLDGDFGGFPIDRLEHSLQTATRAHRDGRDEEYVICALLHDIGEIRRRCQRYAAGAPLTYRTVAEGAGRVIQRTSIC